MKKPIRILSSAMDVLGEIDDYESMFFTRSWHGVGSIELRMNRHKRYADQLLKDNLILVGNDLNKVFIIKHREIELDQEGKVTENWIIKGYSLKSIVAGRVTIPPPQSAYDSANGSYESVMKHYIDNHLVNPIDLDRKVNHLVIAASSERGGQTSYSSRFKNLADEMYALSLASGLGWEISIDLDNKQWIFDVVEGKDLTQKQSQNPPVIFSPQFEAVESMSYVQSDLNYKNFAYIAGQGEGVNRRVVTVGNASGLDRYEIFIDARDVAEVDDDENPIPEHIIVQKLTERGQQQLNEFLQEEYLESQILTHSPFKYEKDYNLGDVVTVQNLDWGATLDTRITEIKEIYEVDGFKIEATFGNKQPTLIQKIKQELAQMSGEIRK